MLSSSLRLSGPPALPLFLLRSLSLSPLSPFNVTPSPLFFLSHLSFFPLLSLSLFLLHPLPPSLLTLLSSSSLSLSPPFLLLHLPLSLPSPYSLLSLSLSLSLSPVPSPPFIPLISLSLLIPLLSFRPSLLFTFPPFLPRFPVSLSPTISLSL